MKIIHIESGLGNQMLSYCEYLALKKMNPDEELFIENIIYDIPECNDIICQWNGYELERIFHVDAPNIKEVVDNEKWSSLISEIKASQFWLKNWNWPVYFQKAFANIGIDVKNVRGDFEEKEHSIVATAEEDKSLLTKLKNTDFYRYIQMKKILWLENKRLPNLAPYKELFYSNNESELTGQRLTFKQVNSGIEKIEDEIRKTFVFPEITDENNKKIIEIINTTNSVAIHARRGDMLNVNYPLYRFGYFRRCVNYIKSQVDNPVFFFFCDPSSVAWTKKNEKVFGLDFSSDRVYFVDWNKGLDSYRDMQVMAMCKHQIVTNSTFGWWAAWLNENPNKITCSHSLTINTTHHF